MPPPPAPASRARPAAPGLLGQQLGRVSPESGGGPDDGGDLVVIDLGVRTRWKPGRPGRLVGHPDIGRVVQQDRGGVGVLADLLAQRGHRAVHGAGGEGDRDLAVVADAGRDGIPGGPLGEEHDLDGDVAALADQLLDQPDSSATRALWALTSGEVPLRSWKKVWASSMTTTTSGHEGRAEPGVGHAQDLGDAALAVDHQPMDLPQHVADVGQVVLGRQPGPGASRS